MTVSAFAELGLTERLLRALKEAQYNNPTPIQKQAIPLLLDGADLLGIAQTGTGKTAAFTLPLLQNLEEDDINPAPRTTRALILAPTRELALQIADSIKTYGRHMNMRLAVVMGGVGHRPQIQVLHKGVDITVATPGRLLDLANQRKIDLRKCDYLISRRSRPHVRHGLHPGCPQDRGDDARGAPDLLFSATMPKEIAKLAAMRFSMSPSVSRSRPRLLRWTVSSSGSIISTRLPSAIIWPSS